MGDYTTSEAPLEPPWWDTLRNAIFDGLHVRVTLFSKFFMISPLGQEITKNSESKHQNHQISHFWAYHNKAIPAVFHMWPCGVATRSFRWSGTEEWGALPPSKIENSDNRWANQHLTPEISSSNAVLSRSIWVFGLYSTRYIFKTSIPKNSRSK